MAVVAVLAVLAVPLPVSPAVTSVAVGVGVSVELPAAQPGGRGSSQGLLNLQPSPEPLEESRKASAALPNSRFLAPNWQEDLRHIWERLRVELFIQVSSSPLQAPSYPHPSSAHWWMHKALHKAGFERSLGF